MFKIYSLSSKKKDLSFHAVLIKVQRSVRNIWIIGLKFCIYLTFYLLPFFRLKLPCSYLRALYIFFVYVSCFYVLSVYMSIRFMIFITVSLQLWFDKHLWSSSNYVILYRNPKLDKPDPATKGSDFPRKKTEKDCKRAPIIISDFIS